MTLQDMSLGEFIKQLTIRMKEAKLQMPFKDEEPWHQLIYQLKTSDVEPKPAFLQEIEFDWDGPYPRSEDIANYIHALHFTGCVSASNPAYDQISLNPKLEEIWSSEQLDGDLPQFIERAMVIAKQEFQDS